MNPKLRFAPGQGLNYPAYTFKTLADVCEIRREIVDLSNLTDVRFVEYSMPAFDSGRKPQVIFGSDAKSGRISICGNVVLFNKLNVRKKRIWNVRNSPDNSVCSAEFIPVIATGVLQDYMYYAVSTDGFTKAVEECSSGTSNSQKRITPSIFLEQKIACPCSQEQQKIAAFFTALDEKISCEQYKVNCIEKIKAGISKRLFAKVGAKCDDDKETCKRYKLGEVATLTKGGSLGKADIDEDGRVPCILYGELYTKYSEVATTIVSKTNAADLLVGNKGDVLLPTSGETAEDIATATCVMLDGVAYGGDLIVIRSDSLYGPYLSYLINTVLWKEIARVAQGKTVVHIGINKIQSIELPVPTLDEQVRVAKILMTIDEKIKFAHSKIEVLKRIKQAFMQQMFI